MTTVFFDFVLNINIDLHQSVFYERDTITFRFNTILMTMTSLKTLMMPRANFFFYEIATLV